MHRGNHLCSLASVKEKIFMTLLKMVRQTLFKAMLTGIGTTPVGCCSGGERLGSIPNTACASGNLQPKNRVGVSG